MTPDSVSFGFRGKLSSLIVIAYENGIEDERLYRVSFEQSNIKSIEITGKQLCEKAKNPEFCNLSVMIEGPIEKNTIEGVL